MQVDLVITHNRLGALAAQLPGLANAIVGKTVADIEAEAKALVPVDTGALKNSITGEMTGTAEGQVSVGQEYGPYVEYGTARQAAQPYLTPAADRARPRLVAAVDAALKGLG